MRRLHKLLLAGAAAAAGSAIALAGFGEASADPKPAVHHLSVFVPGYGIERIDYTGAVAPRVVMQPTAMPVFASPFANFDRVFAQMDAMQAAMDRQMAASLARAPMGANGVTLASLPPGTQSYSVVTTMVGNKVCTHTVQYLAGANGAKPQTISNTSGDCDGVAAPSGSASAIRASAHPAPMRVPRNSI